MEEHMFKIQEVAYLHNISKKTLIYYDKIGLFRPQFVDESNGYRYYHRKEFPILKQIIYLKHIGFSLDEIKELLEHRCHETIITALEKRKAEVALALKQLEEVQQNIDYKLDFYHKTQHISENDLYRPSIKIIPDRRICFFACEQEPSKESIMLAYRKALRYLASKDLFSTQEYGSYVSNLDTDSNLQTYGSFISLPETCDIEHSKVLPAGKYITMYHKGGYLDLEGVAMFIAWIKDNNYSIVGDLYDFCLVDYSFTRDEDEMIQEFQIRVE